MHIYHHTKYSVCLLLILFTSGIYAQENISKQFSHPRILLDFNVGGYWYLSDFSSGNISDCLIGDKKSSLSTQLQLTYFFKEKWGIFAGLGFTFGSGFDTENKNMLQAVSEPFKQNYYITSNLYNDRNNIAEPYLQVGFCYSISKGNWLFSPRIAAGITTINMSRILLELKGIGNNQMEEVQYLIKPGTYTPSRDMGYISPGIDICYRIGKIYLTLDINYQLFPGKYPIWYGRTNRYTNQLIEEKMFSNNHISGRLMGQIGFGIPLKWQ